jgi:hypothetical protein
VRGAHPHLPFASRVLQPCLAAVGLLAALYIGSRACAQQAAPPQISVAPQIIAAAASVTWLPIDIGPPEAVPKPSFATLRGLPPAISLTEGHQVSPGFWAVPLSGLPTLKVSIPAGISGQAEIVISLIGIDGRMLAQVGTKLVVQPALVAPPPEGAPAGSQVSRLAVPSHSPAGATADVKAAETASRPINLSEEERIRAEHALAQGEQYFARGSVLVARQYFQRAADAGLAAAALGLAATYDPVELQLRAVSGVVPDRDEARRWYQRARELGSRDAVERLARLNGN